MISDFTIVFIDTSDYDDKLNGFYINGNHISFEDMFKLCLNNISNTIIKNNIRTQNDFLMWIKKNTISGKAFCYKIKNCTLRISNDGRTVYCGIC